MAKAKKSKSSKTAAKKPVVKAAKKAAKTPVKKAAKPAPKKTASKPAKKAVGKTAPKAVSKTAKKAAPAKAAKVSPKAPAKKVEAPKVSSSVKALAKNLSPLDDRILVAIESGERVTAGGLYIPDSAMTSGNNRGVVQAVGRGHRDAKGNFRPTVLKVGDRILFSEYAGSEITWGGEKFKILRETEVLGLVDAE